MRETLLDKYGGLDIAIRVDSTHFIALQAKWAFSEILQRATTVFEECGNRHWTHNDYDEIAVDLQKIQAKEKMARLGYDRTGVGDGVRKLFHRSIPIYPIVATATKKFELITLINGLFHQGRLIVHDSILYDELFQQEKIVSDAGNLLYRHPQGFHDDRFWSLGFAVEAGQTAIKGLSKMTAGIPNPKHTIDSDLAKIMKDI